MYTNRHSALPILFTVCQPYPLQSLVLPDRAGNLSLPFSPNNCCNNNSHRQHKNRSATEAPTERRSKTGREGGKQAGNAAECTQQDDTLNSRGAWERAIFLGTPKRRHRGRPLPAVASLRCFGWGTAGVRTRAGRPASWSQSRSPAAAAPGRRATPQSQPQGQQG